MFGSPFHAATGVLFIHGAAPKLLKMDLSVLSIGFVFSDRHGDSYNNGGRFQPLLQYQLSNCKCKYFEATIACNHFGTLDLQLIIWELLVVHRMDLGR